jgi:hypothetical protein
VAVISDKQWAKLAELARFPAEVCVDARVDIEACVTWYQDLPATAEAAEARKNKILRMSDGAFALARASDKAFALARDIEELSGEEIVDLFAGELDIADVDRSARDKVVADLRAAAILLADQRHWGPMLENLPGSRPGRKPGARKFLEMAARVRKRYTGKPTTDTKARTLDKRSERAFLSKLCAIVKPKIADETIDGALRDKAENEEARRGTPALPKCGHCRKPFERPQRLRDTPYCSSACRQAAYRKRKGALR